MQLMASAAQWTGRRDTGDSHLRMLGDQRGYEIGRERKPASGGEDGVFVRLELSAANAAGKEPSRACNARQMGPYPRVIEPARAQCMAGQVRLKLCVGASRNRAAVSFGGGRRRQRRRRGVLPYLHSASLAACEPRARAVLAIASSRAVDRCGLA
jgi:hypothetical protein